MIFETPYQTSTSELAVRWEKFADELFAGEFQGAGEFQPAGEFRGAGAGIQVRKTPSLPRSWANFSLF